MYEIDEVVDYVDEGRKGFKVTRHTPAVQVYGSTWKVWLDEGKKVLDALIDDKQISIGDYRVFSFMVGEMNRMNTVDMKQAAMASAMSTEQSYVSKKVRRLRAVGLLRGNMVNPKIVTFGDSKLYPDVVHKWNSLGK